jgi:RNA polymerase primary sigma factor
MKRNSRIQDEDGLVEYLARVADHRLLSREEEVELFEKLEAGDESAREEIARCNLRFVVKLALHYKGNGVPIADLVQEGNLGLLQAIDKFDCHRGFRFSTYAAFYIRQEIQSAIQRTGSMIKLPVRKARLMNKVNETTRRFNEREGREPSVEEIAAILVVPAAKVAEVVELRHSFASLDAEVAEDGGSLMATIADQDAPPPCAGIAREQTRAVVADALDLLSDREQQVMELRYGLRSGRSYSLRGASKVIGLSQEGVRRVEQRAMTKLRRPAVRARLDGLLTA